MSRLLHSLALLLSLLAAPALAWGDLGHETIALIARAHLTPQAQAMVDQLLAADADTLTAPDMAARATWADRWRAAGHRETAPWHFVDIELDAPDLSAACFGVPRPTGPASAGPSNDCVTNKIAQFEGELGSKDVPQAERILALKYLLHFVGDVHQPLHASDNHDRGGNCVKLGTGQRDNLHSYWDTTVVEALGSDPATLATRLDAAITPAEAAAWRKGTVIDWTWESNGVAKSVAYSFAMPSGCPTGAAPVALPPGYAQTAQAAAILQLQRAGVRLAELLNQAAADTPSIAAIAVTINDRRAPATPVASNDGRARCSTAADERGLHGKARRAFRRRCLREAGLR